MVLFVGIDASPQGFAVCLLTVNVSPHRELIARVLTFGEDEKKSTFGQEGRTIGVPGMRTDLSWYTRFELVKLPWRERKRFLQAWVVDVKEAVEQMKKALELEQVQPDYVLIESPIPFSVLRPQTQNLSLNVMYHAVKAMATNLWPDQIPIDVNAQNAKANFVPTAQKPSAGRLATKAQIYDQFHTLFHVNLLVRLKKKAPDKHPISDIVDSIAIAFTGWQRLTFVERTDLTATQLRPSGPVAELSLEDPPSRTDAQWLVLYRLWSENSDSPPPLPDSVPVASTPLNRIALSWLYPNSAETAWAHLGTLEEVIHDVRVAERHLFDSELPLPVFYRQQCLVLSELTTNPTVKAWLLQHSEFLQHIGNMTQSLTEIMHPVSALQLRNHMVDSLSQILHDYIIPLMIKYIGTDPLPFWQKIARKQRPRKRPKALIEARGPLIYWLDLCYRLTNIPHRTQVSQHLKWGPEVTVPYVSKLVQAGTIFNRIWYTDKVGYQSSHMPVSFPLDEQLSAVTFFYLFYVRHAPGKPTQKGEDPAEFAFLGERGGLWTSHMTKAYKQWIQEHLHINPDQLESKGNKIFLHRMRNVMLSSFGVLTHFEFSKLENLAVAMRHSILTMKRNYLDLWARWYQDLHAVSAYSERQGWTMPLAWAQTQHLHVAQLTPLPSALLSQIQVKMRTYEFLSSRYEADSCVNPPLPELKVPWMTRAEAESRVSADEWPEQAPPPVCAHHHMVMRYAGNFFVCPVGKEKRKMVSLTVDAAPSAQWNDVTQVGTSTSGRSPESLPEQIMAQEQQGRSLRYLVKWQGYPDRNDFTWETAFSLRHHQDLIEGFLDRHPHFR